ncbi:MAG: methyl-accepting chemotaxis protein [Desulfobacterales bacterium]|nr:methyl-accepting chemotaxis protein [Desulfobacterales bacterium]
MKHLSLKAKLIVFFLLVGLIPFGVIGMSSYLKSSNALSQAAYNQLEGLREVKKAQITQFFGERQGDLEVLLETVGNLKENAFQKIEAVQALQKARIETLFKALANDAVRFSRHTKLQDAFAAFDNGFQSAAREKSPVYKTVEAKYQQVLTAAKEDAGVYDIFFITDDGDIIATAAQEKEAWTNLKTGPYKDSNLAKAWEKASSKPYAGANGIVYGDFTYYEPSNAAAAFAVIRFAPNSDARGRWGKGESIGSIALQIPVEPINNIAQNRLGLGKTGETYFVGKKDGKISFRSEMLTMGDGKYVIGYEISTPYIESALAGKRSHQVYTDSRGSLVMVVASPLNIKAIQWACVTKIDMEEAIAPKLEGDKDDFYTKYIAQYNYYDLFLIHPNGNVFYSVVKEADYNTNMVDGKYADSGLGSLVRKTLKTKEYGVADFAPYAPSNNEPCGFIAQPLLHDGEVELIVALQLSLDAINRIMQQREGMGETGETYLVGPDKLMRSDSFLNPTDHSVKASFANPSTGSVDTEASRLALSGKTDSKVIIDYNGNPVLSSFAPLNIGEVTWALIAEIDVAEAFAGANAIKWLMVVMSVISTLVIFGIAWVIARALSRPIQNITAGMNECANQVASASGQVSSSSQSMAEGASQQAASIEETSSSMEEMSSMTKLNAENANHADNLMKEVSQVVKSADESMEKLIVSMAQISSASKETSKIIKTIDEIAFQTNLLALNAAVEAARAGEAGSGFAVVADEVRNLAMRAADAAKNTAELIEGTVKKIDDGSELVTSTNEAFRQVAESSAKVGDLVTNISQASSDQYNGIEQVNVAIAEMDNVVQQNAANAEESASASEEMNAQAEQLRDFVSGLFELINGKKDHGTTKTLYRVKSTSHQTKTNISANRNVLVHGPKEVASDQVIPFDDDDKFKDF